MHLRKIKKLASSFFDKDLRELASGSAVVFASKIVAVLLGLVFNLLVAKIYGAEAMGILALVNSFFAIILIPSLMGVQTSILRFIPEYIKTYSYKSAFIAYKKLLMLVLFLSLLIGGVSYSASGYIADYVFNKEDFDWVLSVAAFFILLKAVSEFNLNAIRAYKNIKIFSLLSMSPPVINILMLLLIGIYLSNEYTPVYAILLGSVIFCALSFFLLGMTVDKQELRKTGDDQSVPLVTMAKISFPMFLTSALGVVITQIDILMLGSFLSFAEVGVYAIAVKLATVTSFAIQSINKVIAPNFSELYFSGQKEKLVEAVRTSTKLIFWITLPITAILVLLGKPLLDLFGSDFSAGYYALVFLLIGRLIDASCGSVGYLMNMIGHQKSSVIVMAMSATLNICLNLILIPRYGIEGAAFASMVSVIFYNLISSIYIFIKEDILTINFFSLH